MPRLTAFSTCALLALFALVTLSAHGEDAPSTKRKKFAATCPVSGQPAVQSVSAQTKGEPVYFCCEKCQAAYKASPEKFALATRHQWVQTGEALQVACPVSGQPLDAATAVDFAGTKISFCCTNCQAKFEGLETADQQKLAYQDFEKGFTLQTTCPMSGRAIDPLNFITHAGKKVYFCCPGCALAFKDNPAKYAPKLPQFQK